MQIIGCPIVKKLSQTKPGELILISKVNCFGIKIPEDDSRHNLIIFEQIKHENTFMPILKYHDNFDTDVASFGEDWVLECLDISKENFDDYASACSPGSILLEGNRRYLVVNDNSYQVRTPLFLDLDLLQLKNKPDTYLPASKWNVWPNLSERTLGRSEPLLRWPINNGN